MIKYNMTTGTFENILQGYYGASAGWFVCESKLSSKFPSNVASGRASTNCSLNGIIWRVTYFQDVYYTTRDMQAMAMLKAQSQCNTTMTTSMLCDVIGNLPPYICTKDKYQSWLTSLATAIASAHLVYAIVAMACVWLIPMLEAMLQQRGYKA